ncbi:MAG: MATE family efflux transporter, partial [Bacteroidetes bacterium]|nr:MATE family efflux transporter [Bacteroidota bacterium]
MISMIVDGIIVGNYIGKSALAAVGASFPVIFALISLLIGITGGITIIISQYFGAKDFKSVNRAVDTAYIFLFFASLIIGLSGILFCKDIFLFLDLPEEVMPEALLYIKIYFGGILFMAGLQGTNAILRGMGDSKTPLYFMIIAAFLNVVLELIFIPVLKMGIEGAAIAAVISQGVAFLIATIYLNKKHPYIRISFTKIYFDKMIFVQSLKIGLPSGLQQTFAALGQMALLKIVNGFGTNTIAAYTIAGRIDSFAILPAMNFSMAIMSFVGQNLGAGKYNRVKKGYISTQRITGAITIFVTLFIMLFSAQIMNMFTKDNDVIQIGADYLMIVSPFYILFSIMFINTGVFRGAGDTLIPMFITLFTLWLIRIPLAVILSKSFGIHGIWWSTPIAWFVGTIFTVIYYIIGRWKKKVIVNSIFIEEIT